MRATERKNQKSDVTTHPKGDMRRQADLSAQSPAIGQVLIAPIKTPIAPKAEVTTPWRRVGMTSSVLANRG